MHPILFEISNVPLIGTLTIYTYGALVAAGFVAGILWVVFESKRLGFNPGYVLDMAFYIIIAAILGSRLLYLMVNDPSRLLREPWSVFMIWEGGLVFYGGLIAATITCIAYVKIKKLPVLTFCDIFAPTISIGHFFGRLGCLSAGCCHGRECANTWYALVFPSNPATFAPAGIPLYPTQLVEAIGNLLIFFILVLFRKHKKFPGQVIALYLLIYGVFRFTIEFFRGDTDRGYIIEGILSTSQGVSLCFVAIGLTIMIWGYRKVGRSHA